MKINLILFASSLTHIVMVGWERVKIYW